MSNSQDNRVLGRTGARLLTEQELQAISGGVHTFVCSIDPLTGAKDGDACR
jgi:bacteriocin-like protein